MNIVLDFDRTLFDTKKFAKWFADEVAERSGRTASSVLKEAEEEYYIYSGKLYYYDMIAQLQSIFGKDADNQLRQIKQKALQNSSFLFDDVRKNFNALKLLGAVTILTYGKEDYQLFKLSLCPEFKDTPVIIVMSPKGPHLEKNFDSKERCIFVDDKDAHGELPDWVEFYHLQRDGTPVVQGSPHGVIHTFDELMPFIASKSSS